MPKGKKQNISLRMTAALAMLAAISIILGKYLAIPVGDTLRFSFENLPIIFAGIAFGAIPAILVAITADVVGCVLVGFAINPVVTLGAAAIGALSGVIPMLIKKHTKIKRLPLVIITVITSHIIGSVIIKTLGLAAFYNMPVTILMLWRMLNYTAVGSLEILLIFILFSREEVCREIDKIRQKSK